MGFKTVKYVKSKSKADSTYYNIDLIHYSRWNENIEQEVVSTVRVIKILNVSPNRLSMQLNLIGFFPLIVKTKLDKKSCIAKDHIDWMHNGIWIVEIIALLEQSVHIICMINTVMSPCTRAVNTNWWIVYCILIVVSALGYNTDYTQYLVLTIQYPATRLVPFIGTLINTLWPKLKNLENLK